MDVTPDELAFAADDHAALGVDFVADQSVNDVHAVFLEQPRPLNVVGFVEARPQFHDRRDLFALARGVFEGADDARIAAGAVKRLFDREHVGIRGGLFQKIHHAVERLIRMMQQNVAFANRGEQVRLAAQIRADRSDERRVTQPGRMIAFIQRHQPCGIQRAVDEMKIILRQAQRFQQSIADHLRAIVVGLEPHGVALAAIVQFVLHRFEQIGRFFLVDVELAVSGDAKRPVAEQTGSRK